MKKYFMKGTEDEVQFGEDIVADVVREMGGKCKHTHVDCVFLPELVSLLLEKGVIEEREFDDPKEEEEEEDFIHFENYDEVFNALFEDNESIEAKLIELRTLVMDLQDLVQTLNENVKTLAAPKKCNKK